jgi:hypothetical protein
MRLVGGFWRATYSSTAFRTCAAVVVSCSNVERRLMNQAFFKRIWVTEDGVVGWEYNAPFSGLLRKHQAPEPIFTAEPVVANARPRRTEPIRTRYERKSPAQHVRAFFRQGWKEFNLAEGVGFEPTEGCPSHAFQACRFGRSRIPPGKEEMLVARSQHVSGDPAALERFR